MNDDDVKQYRESNAETWTKLVRAGYDVYRDEINTPAFLAMLDDVAGRRGLDLGCGEGHNTRLLARRGAKMSAVDIASTFVARAQERELEDRLGIDYHESSAADVPFDDLSFDFVTAFMSLMDMPRAERAVAEAWRVQTPASSPTS